LLQKANKGGEGRVGAHAGEKKKKTFLNISINQKKKQKEKDARRGQPREGKK